MRRRGPAGEEGSFASRSILPAKKLSSASSQPTTAGSAPSGKSAAEKDVDAIEAAAQARLAAAPRIRMKERSKRPQLAGLMPR